MKTSTINDLIKDLIKSKLKKFVKKLSNKVITFHYEENEILDLRTFIIGLYNMKNQVLHVVVGK